MRMTMRRSGAAIVSVLMASFFASAADWPDWRGPERTGISQETGLLKQWPTGGPVLLWHVSNIGDGYEAPAIKGSRLYSAQQPRDGERVRAGAVGGGWKTCLDGAPRQCG